MTDGWPGPKMWTDEVDVAEMSGSLNDQIVYVTNRLEGRRKGHAHMQDEERRLRGEVRIFEALLKTLQAKKAEENPSDPASLEP